MGQGLSCAADPEHGLFCAVQYGDSETVKTMLERESTLLHQRTAYDRHSLLHIAAANGQIEVMTILFFKFSRS